MTCQLALTSLEASTSPAANRLTPPVACPSNESASSSSRGTATSLRTNESDDRRPDKRLPDGFPKFTRDNREKRRARHPTFSAFLRLEAFHRGLPKPGPSRGTESWRAQPSD